MVKITEIIERFDYYIAGDYSGCVTGINWYNKASVSEIAVAYKTDDILNTKAAVVLTAPCFVDTDKTLIFCDDFIEIAMIKIVRLFIEKGLFPDYSINCSTYTDFDGSKISLKAVLGKNVHVEPFCIISDDVVIGDNCIIESNVKIGRGTVIGSNVIIRSGAVIGGDPYFCVMENEISSFCGIKRTILNDDVSIGSNSIVQRGVLSDTVIGRGTKIGDLVVIGHDSVIGKNSRIVSQCGISGNVTIGDHTVVYGQSGIANNVCIGNNVTVKGKTSVMRNIPDYAVAAGSFGKIIRKQRS